MSDKQPQQVSGIVSSAVLAQLFDCDEKTIRNLAARGIVVKKGRGEYIVAQSIRNYVRHLRDVAAGRGGEEKQLGLTEQRARFAKEQADHAALKNATLRGDLVPAIEVERRWASILSFIRAKMLAIPSDLTLSLPHLTRHDTDVIDRSIRDALEEASEGE